MSNLQVVIPLFPQFTALDGIGPYEVLQRIPSIDVTFIGHQRGEVRSENGFLGITADGTFEDLPAPRHHRVPRRRGHPPARARRARASTGCAPHTPPPRSPPRCARARLVLGAAGLLNGLTATTHWALLPRAREAQGDRRLADRVVEHLDRRIITAAGVSSGIDMALRLVELLVDRTAAEAAQLMIEYDPQPPFDLRQRRQDERHADGGSAVMHRVIEYAQLRQ